MVVKVVDEVTAVHIFPIKSCREATVGRQLPRELAVGPRGFLVGAATDRGWVLADAEDLFVSQRGWDEQQARKHRGDRILATVAVDIGPDELTVEVAGHGSLRVPLEADRGGRRSVRIFGPDLAVTDEGEEPARFFSELLGRPVRLTQADPSRPRMLPDRYHRPGAANQSAGADGRPFSLASQASLDHLHDLVGWAPGTWPLTQYRANIDIDGRGLGPFGEDTLRRVRIGKMEAHVVKAISRCPIPNIDQASGDDSDRPSTRLLRAGRMGWNAGDDPSGRPEPFFAQSLNHVHVTEPEQTVRVGDPLRVLEAGESNTVLRS